MLDRRSLRFWLTQAAKIWLLALLGSIIMWGFVLLLSPRHKLDQLLTPAAFTYFLLLFNCFVTTIHANAGNCNTIPIVLSLGATRRATFIASGLAQLLPQLATLTVVLLIGLFPGQTLSLAAVLLLIALFTGWAALCGLVGLLGMRGGRWNTTARLFTGLSAGFFGATLSASITAPNVPLSASLADLPLTPGVAITIAAALTVAATATLTGYFIIRRTSVRF